MTPMGPLDIDIESKCCDYVVIEELKQIEGFHYIDIDDEEDEHSIEMQLPYIVKSLGRNIKIVPIMSGPVNE